ncbi:MAG: hypothetical protein RL272_1136 [Candidatus Parcubacteria bacterium]|jgi:hypothetical protein
MKKAKSYVDGIVGYDLYGQLVAADAEGNLHIVPSKEQHDLKEGDRISFIPRRYAKKSYVSRPLLRP